MSNNEEMLKSEEIKLVALTIAEASYAWLEASVSQSINRKLKIQLEEFGVTLKVFGCA